MAACMSTLISVAAGADPYQNVEASSANKKMCGCLRVHIIMLWRGPLEDSRLPYIALGTSKSV